jgi:hypothetical protein
MVTSRKLTETQMSRFSPSSNKSKKWMRLWQGFIIIAAQEDNNVSVSSNEHNFLLSLECPDPGGQKLPKKLEKCEDI